MMNVKYPKVIEYLRKKIKGTQWENHLFVVGGCCRDIVMKREIHDVDLTVDLPLGSVRFANWLRSRRLTIGEPLVFQRYATARLKLKAFPDDELEIVQTRSDKYGSHNSDNPAAAFGSLTDDCTRRDLTINSLYYDISKGLLLDLSGMALDDIHNHIIRTPAHPDRTFDDDPLRIVRCIRFACSLGWEIDGDTYDAMCRNIRSINVASKERIRNEFDKLLSCPRPSEALGMLERCGAMAIIMPELAPVFGMPDNSSNPGSVWQHSLRTVKAMADIGGDLNMRLAALLCDAGKAVSFVRHKNGKVHFPGHDRRSPGVINALMHRLRYEPKITNEIIFLARYHTAAKSWGDKAEKMSDADLRKLQMLCDDRNRFDRLLMLIHADNLSNPEKPERACQVPAIRERAARLRSEGSEMFGYRLPIQSQHIRRLLQIPAGRKVEQCKDYLLAQALENPKITREECRRILRKNYTVSPE